MMLGTGDFPVASRLKGSPLPSQAERLKEWAPDSTGRSPPLPSKNATAVKTPGASSCLSLEQCLGRGATHGRAANWGPGAGGTLARPQLLWPGFPQPQTSDAQTYKVHSLVPSPAPLHHQHSGSRPKSRTPLGLEERV